MRFQHNILLAFACRMGGIHSPVGIGSKQRGCVHQSTNKIKAKGFLYRRIGRIGTQADRINNRRNDNNTDHLSGIDRAVYHHFFFFFGLLWSEAERSRLPDADKLPNRWRPPSQISN
jgi:hypothetical protein